MEDDLEFYEQMNNNEDPQFLFDEDLKDEIEIEDVTDLISSNSNSNSKEENEGQLKTNENQISSEISNSKDSLQIDLKTNDQKKQSKSISSSESKETQNDSIQSLKNSNINNNSNSNIFSPSKKQQEQQSVLTSQSFNLDDEIKQTLSNHVDSNVILPELEMSTPFQNIHFVCIQMALSLRNKQTFPVHFPTLVTQLKVAIPTVDSFSLVINFDQFLSPLFTVMNSIENLSPPQQQKSKSNSLTVFEETVIRDCLKCIHLAFERIFSTKLKQKQHPELQSDQQQQLQQQKLKLESSTNLQIFRTFAYLLGSMSSFEEETKVELVECHHSFLQLLENDEIGSGSTTPVNNSISINLLAFLIHSLLELIATERSKSLREKSTEVLLEYSRSLSRSYLSKFLPGIVSGLSKVVVGDYKQGHFIMLNALKVVTLTIVKVMNSKFCGEFVAKVNISTPSDLLNELKTMAEKTQDLSETTTNKVQQQKSKSQQPNITSIDNLDQQWFDSSIEKIKQILKELFSLQREHALHPNVDFRLQFSKSAFELLSNCAPILPDECISSLLDVIVMSTQDGWEEVSRPSYEFLSKLSQSPELLRFSAIDLLKKNLYQSIQSLSRLSHTGNDQQMSASLKLILGQFQLLGQMNELQTIVVASFEVILENFCELMTFETRDLILEDWGASAVQSDDQSSTNQNSTRTGPLETMQVMGTGYPKKVFRYFVDEKLIEILKQIGRTLGIYVDISILCDSMLQRILSDSQNRKQLLFLFIEIVNGQATTKKTSTQWDLNVARTVVLTLTSEELWQGPLDSNFSNASEVVSMESINNHALTVSLALEGVGMTAKLMESQWKSLLIDYLYPIVEKLGSESLIISRSAWQTLTIIAKNCGYQNVASLIAENADYLIDTICQRLKRLEMFPRTPLVLRGILLYAKTDVISQLEDTLEAILNALDTNPRNNQTVMFLRILQNVVTVYGKAIESGLIDLAQFEEREDENGAEPEKQRKKTFVCRILEHMQYFLASRSREVKLTCLDVISKAIPIVMKTDKKDFLPAIHTLWSPILQRFSDRERDLTVLTRVLELIMTIAEFSGDFISRKFIDELWPHMKRKCKEESERKTQIGFDFKLSNDFKFRLSILKCISLVLPSIRIAGSVVREMSLSTRLFLSSKQPIEIQEEAVKLFKQLIRKDSDSMFYYLHKWNGSHFNSDFDVLTSKISFGNGDSDLSLRMKELLDFFIENENSNQIVSSLFFN